MSKPLPILAAVAFFAAASPALASTNWTLGSATAPTETAWSASSNATSLSSGSVYYYSGGAGVHSSGESTGSPQHAMDNDGKYESLLLDFGPDRVQLESVKVGWAYNDSDLFVLAYTGSSPFSGSLAGTSYSSLLGSGWTLVGNYANVGQTTVGLGNSSTASSFWLIGAGGFSAGIGVTNDAGTSCSWWSCQSYTRYDYVKIASVGGTVRTPQPPEGNVPEPATLALLGLAFFGMLGMRRHPG